MIAKIIYIFCLACTISSTFLGPDQLSIGQNKPLYFNPPTMQGHAFFINITSKLPDEDLTFLTFPKTPSSNPILIISRGFINMSEYDGNENKTKELIIKNCSSSGVDICTIPAANISTNSSVFITALCETKCFFDLQVNYHIEKLFNLSTMVILNFKDKTSQIIKFAIPEEKTENIDHLLIESHLLNLNNVKEPFHIYVNQGNDLPSSSSYDYKLETTWNEGKGVSIEKHPKDNETKSLCFQCNFTVMIEADEGSRISIKSELVSNKREIKLGTQITDIINQNENITFVLKKNVGLINLFDLEDFHFKLIPYSGYPILYININTLPDRLDNYTYKIDGSTEEEFVLTARDRAKLYGNITTIYLTIYGYTTSAFFLSVYPVFDNQKRIDFGVVETGILQYKEITNYKFFLRDVDSLNITVDLINEIGASDIMIKNCGINSASCFFTYDNYLDRKNLSLLLATESQENKIHFQFEHKMDECKKIKPENNILGKIINWLKDLIYNSKKECVYVIGVVANHEKFAMNKFNLLLNHDKKVIELHENQVIRNSLTIHTSQEYVFKVLNDETIQSITFQFTSISGEISAFCSRNHSPNRTIFEKRTEHDFDAISYLKTDNISLNGTYFIKVVSYSSAFYTITPIITRNHSINESNPHIIHNHSLINNGTLNFSGFHAIKLYNGLTQKIAYQTNYSMPNYFQISLNYSKEELKQVFHFNLIPLQGTYLMFLGVDFVPNIDNYTWKSYNNSISIYPSDPKFKNPCIIYILIRNVHTPHIENYEFLITYSSNTSIIDLNLGIPIHTFLNAGDVRHYIFDLNVKSMVEYIFSKHINNLHSDSLKVFISTNPTNKYPNEKQFDLEMNESSLVISHEKVSEICYFKPKDCKMFITFQATENTELSFIVKTKDTEIILIDGEPLTIPFPQSNEPFKLYFNAPKKRIISISSYSIYKKLAIYANIIPLDTDHSGKETWPFPTNTSFEHSSLSHVSFDSSSLALFTEETEMAKCFHLPHGCVVTLRIYPHEVTSFYSYVTHPTFTVVASSEIIRLTPGISHVDYVKDKAYKYYLVHVEANQSLFISVNPLSSGDPDLLISYGIQKRPTLDNYQWVVRTFGGENIEISPNDLEIKTKEKLPGFFAIAVFGFKNCTFSITTIVGNMKFMKIFSGTPILLSVQPEETIYIEYFHYLNESFKIIIFEDLGEVEIYINSKEKKQNYVESLPKKGNQNTYNWTNIHSTRKNLITVRKDDKHFCLYCQYMIAVFSQKPAKVTLSLAISNHSSFLQSGKTFHDWVLAYEINSFSVYSISGNVDITVLVYLGDPEISVKKSFGPNSKEVIQKSRKNKNSNLIHMQIFNEEEVKKSGHFGISYTIYVTSTDNKECHYSITATTTFQEKFLQYGNLDFTSLKPGSSQKLIFTGFLNESEKNINQTVTITLALSNIKAVNEELQIKNEFDYFYPNVTFEILNPNNSDKPMKADIIKQFFSGKLLNYVIKPENSKILINILNAGNETMNFTVMINKENFNVLLPNTQNFGLVPLDHSDKYEIYTSHDGVLLVEAFECSGKIQILSTINYQKALDEQYDEKTINYMENHLILTQRVNQDHLFLTIKPYKIDSEGMKKLTHNKSNQTSDEAYYKLSSYLLPSISTSPYDKFYYNQQTKWVLNEILLNISIETIKSVDQPASREYEVIEYLYALYISNDFVVLDSVLHCNSPLNSKKSNELPYISLNYASLYYNDSSHPKEIASFIVNVSNIYNLFYEKEEKTFQPLYFGVQAKTLVKGHENFLTLTFIYEINQMYLPKSIVISKGNNEKNSSNYVLVICLVFCLTLTFLAIGIYFFRRYRYIKKRLDFEVYSSRQEEIIDQSHESNSGRKDYQGFSDEKNQTEI